MGRDKDAVDIISLIKYRDKDIDLELMKEIATKANLGIHVLDRIRDYAVRIKRGELDRI